MQVLVVDDDDIAVTVAKKILTAEGHEVLVAENGEEALQLLTRSQIRVVVSDWNMPEMNGLELCRRLRELKSVEYIYIIIVTARNSKEDMLTGLSAGADDFITKPFEPAELLVRVRNAERILALETTSLTLFSLAKLAESKDPDTGNHLERIRAYTRVLAQQLITKPGFSQILPPRFPELLYQTSPLHDIGKVGIPDYVLLKPGSLSDDEWVVMKKHSEIGAETLDAALKKFPGADFLRSARDIAWAHHERWDGTGYPRGLREEEIPLSARIVALADVYDAVTMKRTYKSALAHSVAYGIIVEGSGKHFDPQIVQAFLEREADFIAIRESNYDPSMSS
jgi:putative two-component system response regulator